MIDVENIVFDNIRLAIETAYPDASVYDEYVLAPATFPSISVLEQDNYTDTNSLPLSQVPAGAILMYEINVYSNKQVGKKQECRSIMKVIDAKLVDMGFVLTTMTAVPNLENATIYRLVARYRKLQPKGGTL